MILVTGGAGFIGANFVPRRSPRAASRSSTSTSSPTPATSATSPTLRGRPAPRLRAGRHRRRARWSPRCSREHRPRAVVHLAAEAHVDRSIDGPAAFVQTNVVGTFTPARGRARLLDGARRRARRASASCTSPPTRSSARSAPTEPAFTEETPYAPNCPYSASKAASDHLVRAWHHTYGLPALTTNCSNNYGPYQFPEKLIPLMILNALAGKPLPVYGDGEQRPRLALRRATTATRIRARARRAGAPGETYNIGGNNEKTQPRGRARALRAARRAAPDAARPPRRADHLRHATAPGTTAATPSTPRKIRARAGLEAARDVRDGPAQDRALVPRQRRLGARRCERRLPQWIERNYAARGAACA